MRAGWNEAEPPVLPPLTPRERLRLGGARAWSVVALAVLFAVFLSCGASTSPPSAWPAAR